MEMDNFVGNIKIYIWYGYGWGYGFSKHTIDGMFGEPQTNKDNAQDHSSMYARNKKAAQVFEPF